MAESEEQGQGQASPGDGAGTQDGASGKKGVLLIIAIVVVLLALVGGGITAYFLVFGGSDKGVVASSPEEAKFIEQYNLRSQSSIEDLKPSKEPIFSGLYPYTVNMRDGKHMMQITFRCLLYDNMAVEYLKTRRPAVDDAFLEMLSEVRPEDLRNRAGLELLKIKILRTINSFFEDSFIETSISKDRNPVKRILIVDYYIN